MLRRNSLLLNEHGPPAIPGARPLHRVTRARRARRIEA